jgi:hypothetical protein
MNARFRNQANHARAQTKNRQWSQMQTGYGMRYAIGAKDTKRMDMTLRKGSFEHFAANAYSAKDGYAIRQNPMTGEKEMFVRGTTFKNFGAEWFQNLFEHPKLKKLFLHKMSKGSRERHSKKLAKIARDQGVDIIYGHSRGGAVIDDMHVPGATKLGLDGAFLLKTDKNSTTLNYRQKQLFDKAIGGNHKNTVTTGRWYNLATSKNYHSVYKKSPRKYKRKPYKKY